MLPLKPHLHCQKTVLEMSVLNISQGVLSPPLAPPLGVSQSLKQEGGRKGVSPLGTSKSRSMGRGRNAPLAPWYLRFWYSEY
jgi:hypothetical protein